MAMESNEVFAVTGFRRGSPLFVIPPLEGPADMTGPSSWSAYLRLNAALGL